MAAKLTRHDFYESVADLRAAVSPDAFWQSEYNKSQANGYITSTSGEVSRFGISGGAVAVAHALVNGYPAGEKKISAMHDSVKPHLPVAVGLGRRLVRGSMGDSLDIHAVNRGAVDKAWESRVRLIKRGHSSIRIICDIGGNWNVSANALQWRGVAAVCLSEIMAQARYAVEIVAAFGIINYTRGGRKNGAVSCVVKPAGASADMGFLAASLCLPGFFRSIGFAAIVRMADNDNAQPDGGLGHHLTLEGVYPAADNMAQVIVPSTVDDESSALQWIKSTVGLLQVMGGKTQ